jgi:hypothetical protein
MLVSEMGDGAFVWTMCGFVSALATTTAAAPVDLVRTRVMAANDRSAWQMTQVVLRTEGVRGFFRGWLASFSRFGPHFTISWPLIEMTRKYLFKIDSFFPSSHSV